MDQNLLLSGKGKKKKKKFSNLKPKPSFKKDDF